ncbi:MAG: hypothetical protein L0177_17175 [Chloroflexi bacterium]|nr:hypothetical protein [Chloroflexota bacterium]
MTLQTLREDVRRLLADSIRPGSGEDARRDLIDDAINNNFNEENVLREFLYLHRELSQIVPRNGFRTRFESLATSTKGIGIIYYNRPGDQYRPPEIGTVLIPTVQQWRGHLKFYIRDQQQPPRMPCFEPETSGGQQVIRYGYPTYRCVDFPNRGLSDSYISMFRDSATRIN